MRYLLDGNDELISERELAEDITMARRNYKNGEVYKLKSLADLM